MCAWIPVVSIAPLREEENCDAWLPLIRNPGKQKVGMMRHRIMQMTGLPKRSHAHHGKLPDCKSRQICWNKGFHGLHQMHEVYSQLADICMYCDREQNCKQWGSNEGGPCCDMSIAYIQGKCLPQKFSGWPWGQSLSLSLTYLRGWWLWTKTEVERRVL